MFTHEIIKGDAVHFPQMFDMKYEDRATTKINIKAKYNL